MTVTSGREICHIGNMTDGSKSAGSVEENRVAGDHSQKRSRHRIAVRVSPSELVRLLAEPLRFDAAAKNPLARSLARHLRRLERLKKLSAGRDFLFQPQRVHVPNLSKLSVLEHELRELPTRRKLLTVKEFATYVDVLRRMQRCVAGLAAQVRGFQHLHRQEAYKARIGRIFLDAPDELLESFIVNRRNRTGSNLHAAFLARIRNDRLPREKLVEWGRKGAQARWARRRAATPGEESIPSPVESSLNGAEASNARE
jgi:hypothetical protein